MQHEMISCSTRDGREGKERKQQQHQGAGGMDHGPWWPKTAKPSRSFRRGIGGPEPKTATTPAAAAVENEWKQPLSRRCSGRVPVVGGVLVELPLWGEDDGGDLGVAEDGDLVRLLEEAVAALGEGHLPVYLVLYPLQLHLAAPHLGRSLSSPSIFSAAVVVLLPPIDPRAGLIDAAAEAAAS